MKKENKDKFLKGLKSVAWRIGMMALMFIVDFLIKSLGLFDMSPTLTTMLGLMLGEVSKMLNVKFQEMKAFAAIGRKK